LLATKLDLGYHPTLNRELAKSFVKENNLVGFIEISSKNRLNLEDPFRMLIKHRFGCDEETAEFLDYEIETSTKPIKTTG
jgi:hypothetical protein